MQDLRHRQYEEKRNEKMRKAADEKMDKKYNSKIKDFPQKPPKVVRKTPFGKAAIFKMPDKS